MPATPTVACVSSARAAHHPRHHYRLAAGLAKAGYDVVMLAQPDLTPGHEDAVPIRYLPVRSNRLTRMASAPLSLLRALRMRPDAIYVLTLDLLPWAALLKLLRPGIAVVYDSNDEYDTFMLIKEWLPRPVRPVLRRVFRWLEPWLARHLDAATTALPATQEKFVAARVRSTLVRNFPPAEIADGSPHGPDFDHDVLLGGSLPEEQIPLLAETARLLKERQGKPVRWLTAVRNCGDSDRQLLERLLDQEGVREDFDLRYNRPFTEMKELMARSRVGFVLYPSGVNYASRIPIRIFEYMAAGVPFVASDHPTTRLFTEGHDVAELVPAGDTAAFAEALGNLLADPERQRAMSLRGPELVRESYNWELESRRLTDVFDSLLGGSSETRVREPASAGSSGARTQEA